MTEVQRVIGMLLSAAIRNQSIEEQINVNWKEIFKISEEHQILPLLYPVLKNYFAKENLQDEDLMGLWYKVALTSALEQNKQLEDFHVVLEALKQAAIPFILLKGLILRDLYPRPELRTMGDADILIKPEHLNTACAIMKGFKYAGESTDNRHMGFSQDGYLPVELHTRLMDERFSEEVRSWESALWDNAKPIRSHGIPTLTLSDDDQFIYLVLHMAGHLMKAGFGLRQLSDLALFIEAKRDSMNWLMLQSKAEELGIRQFITQLMELCNKVLEVDINGLWVKCDSNGKVTELFTNDVFSGGVFGHTPDRIVSGILFSKIGNRKELPNPALRILFLLFPPYRVMKHTYKYIARYPCLLPAAWVHRIINHMFRRKSLPFKASNWVSAIQGHGLCEERYKLLNQLGLLENL